MFFLATKSASEANLRLERNEIRIIINKYNACFALLFMTILFYYTFSPFSGGKFN